MQVGNLNKTKALEAAKNLFWAQGAENASYNDIVKATGLSRKFLYSQWPHKDALIEETMTSYHQQLRDFLTASMAKPGKSGLAQFWDQFENIAHDVEWRGCYLYRTASGPFRENGAISAHFETYFAEFSSLVAEKIKQGQDAGEFSKSLDPKIVGAQSFAIMGAISTLGAFAGYTDQVGQMFQAGRAACGLSA